MSDVTDHDSRPTPSRRGGKRAGAGRPKTGRCHDAPHRTRPSLSPRHPAHIVMRMRVRVSWRTRDYYAMVHRALRGTLGRTDFRIVHMSIQTNHLHLLVEAADRRALTRGMQSFTIRLARIVRREHGGCGPVFAYRYHATQIRTASHARHALAYVLNNWRRHRVDNESPTAKLDPYSSAVLFKGWRGGVFQPPRSYEPLPVSPPTTNLLGSEWQKFGLIDVWEQPGPLW